MPEYKFKIEVITTHEVSVTADNLYEAAKVISRNKKANNHVYRDGTRVLSQPSTRTRVWSDSRGFGRKDEYEIKGELRRSYIRTSKQDGSTERTKICTNEQIGELDL